MSRDLLAVVNLEDKFARFSGTWAPRIVAQLNDYHLKIVRMEGEFVWHSHPETDEVFYVVEGTLEIRLRERESRWLRAGELVVVPRGVEHQPVAHGECRVLLIEPADTINTGEATGELTVNDPQWI